MSSSTSSPTLFELYWKLDRNVRTLIRLYFMSYGTPESRAIRERINLESEQYQDTENISLWTAQVMRKEIPIRFLTYSWRSTIIKCDLEIAFYTSQIKHFEGKMTKEEKEEEHFCEQQLRYYIDLQKVYFKKHMDYLENGKLKSPTAKLIAIAKIKCKYNLKC